jgi:hypothetical protein
VINVSDGSLAEVINPSAAHLNGAAGIAFDGAHIWITNSGGNSLSELNASDGQLVQVLSGPSYGFGNPSAIAFDGHRLWTANFGGNSVTPIPDR